jgi:hypothetical protein
MQRRIDQSRIAQVIVRRFEIAAYCQWMQVGELNYGLQQVRPITLGPLNVSHRQGNKKHVGLGGQSF